MEEGEKFEVADVVVGIHRLEREAENGYGNATEEQSQGEKRTWKTGSYSYEWQTGELKSLLSSGGA